MRGEDMSGSVMEAPACGLNLPRQRQDLANAVMLSTRRIVSDALHGRWFEVLDAAEERRQLLERIECVSCMELGLSSVEALRAAVYESDRAIACIVAHALVQTRRGMGFVSTH